MKIIIVGAGKVGNMLATKLASENHDVTVIDKNPAVVENLVNICDIMGVCGNGATYAVLHEAGAENNDLLVATTPSDEVNILACLVAKKLGVKHMIARVRNPEYEQQLRFMRDDLGVSMVINPEKAAALEISRVLRFPTALKLETFSKGRIELVEYRIKPDDSLVGVALFDLYSNVHSKVLVCAVERGDDVFIPSGDFVLSSDDSIYLTATSSELESFFRALGVLRAGIKSVFIVGASKICYYLARDLEATGTKIKIIDNNAERCSQMSELLPHALVIQGDGTDSEILGEEGVCASDAFVALTGLDEANIILAMYATKQKIRKVVAKLNRPSFIGLAETGGMTDSIVSPAAVTSEQILQYVRAMQNSMDTNIKTLHRIVDDRVEALEFGVDNTSSIIGIPFNELKLKDNLLIAGIARRDGTIIIPSGKDYLKDGDSVIVVTTDTSLRDLKDILK